MKHTLTLAITLPLFTVTPACDSPDDEAELEALDVEDDVEVPADKENTKVPVGEFDLKANVTPQEGPPGKCCKAKCSWDPYTWRQLPEPWTKADGCNINADWWCKYSPQSPGYWQAHAEDAEWRTCG